MSIDWKQWEGRLLDGRFPLHRCLQAGPASAVFLTEHQGKQVAIKLVLASASAAAPLVKRWNLAARLSHPHLAKMWEAGTCRVDDVELAFAVTDYGEEVLAEVVAERTLDIAETRQMLEPMLAALNYLHTSGYAHGHLTPSNIMAVGDQLKLASDSIQRFGESREASAEGDVWSLGMTLVEVLTRQKPDFEEGRYEEPLLPEMPAPFLEIARRSLHRDPQQRLTIDQIATLLREPVRASRPAVAAKSRVASVRFALGGLVLLAFVAAIVYARWIKKDETVASAPPAAPQVAAEPRSTPSTAVPIKPEPRAEKPVNAKPIEAKPVEAPKHEPTVAAADPKEEPDTNAVDAGPLPAGIVKQVVPEVTRKARATIHGKVKTSIKVSVDAAGNVSGASIDSQGSSLYFAGLALGAVRKWQFASAEGAGTQEWIINFEFTREKTRINPVRVGR